jgi:pantoate--beta-alanine ligase
MKTVITFKELWTELKDLERPLGFVPTMGYLHDGHLSLVRKAGEECRSVVVSIFTNPTQFAAEEDLENYPTDLEKDLTLLENEKVDLVWIPTAAEMYPKGFQTWIEVDNLGSLLEGKFRPTHFKGVATVVAKLFNAVQPERSYFGQKDAQQAAVIQRMARDLNYPIDIIICPIIREPDGLAMSSRNSFLNETERKAARCLFRGLTEVRRVFEDGERSPVKLREIVLLELAKEKLARVQYVSCADPFTFQEQEQEIDSCLISIAVHFGQTRLIDNILLPVAE